MSYSNGTEEKIEVFTDTMRLCKENDRLRKVIQDSVSSQYIIHEEDVMPETKSRFEKPADIVVSGKRSFEAASGYPGKQVCVLNFASATNPGGGVERGASAQEECLCRCSTLYPCIAHPSVKADFHFRHRNMLNNGVMDSLYNDDCIFTPRVTVFKSDTDNPELMRGSEWYEVDIITCAAPNLRERPANRMNPNGGSTKAEISSDGLRKLHAKRANRILDIAKENKADVVILGAFGCGAFMNPPDIAAKGIFEAVEKHRYDFETVELAVYTSKWNSANYDAFVRVFKG